MRELSADKRATCEDDDPEVNRWTFDDDQEAMGFGWTLLCARDTATVLIPIPRRRQKSSALYDDAQRTWRLIRKQSAAGIPVARKAFRLVTKQMLISGYKPTWMKEGE